MATAWPCVPVLDARGLNQCISMAPLDAKSKKQYRSLCLGAVANLGDASRDFSTWQHAMLARPSVSGQEKSFAIKT